MKKLPNASLSNESLNLGFINKSDIKISSPISSENNRDFSEKIIIDTDSDKAKNTQDLKKLVKVLDSLIESGKENIAQTYLEGFLESKNMNNLQDYLNKLT